MQLTYYYNTNGEEGAELLESKSKAKTQEEYILKYFQSNPDCLFTPFEISDVLERSFVSVPITSIRRAMTNLTKAGYLKKTDIKRRGKYGKKNHLWSLNTERSKQVRLWNDISKLP